MSRHRSRGTIPHTNPAAPQGNAPATAPADAVQSASAAPSGQSASGAASVKSEAQKPQETAYYRVRMTHSEDSFTALAHMQYDLFCMRNYVARMIVSVAAMLLGAKLFSEWYGILLVAYGAYLMTGKYNAANHTARKLVKQLQDAKLPFPSSEYIFEKDKMRVVSAIDQEEMEPLYYSAVVRMGADSRYFYLFRDNVGGYMVPKDQLNGDPTAFRDFIEKKTGKVFVSRRTSPLGRVNAWMRRRRNEPYHL